MKPSGRSIADNPPYLILLLIISAASHFPFVLEGIGEPDSARIATVVIDRISNGANGPLVNFYHTDTIPLYVLSLSWVMKLYSQDFTYLPLIMNYTNAIFSSLIIVPSYLLIKRLFRNSRVAFYSVMVFIFAPSFFLASVYGAPHLIALFFFFVSAYLFLLWIDDSSIARRHCWLLLSSAAFTLTILFKSSIILGCGIYPGILYIRRVKDKRKILFSLIYLCLAFFIFIFLRQHIIEPSAESITSRSGFLAYINYFLIDPTPSVIIRQIKPAILGAGIFSSLLGVISFLFYLLKKRSDMLIFMITWTALPNLYWISIWGNNARHHLIAVLPLLVMVVFFLYERSPRFLPLLTGALILGNFLLTAPSPSTYFPSGSLFKSQALLEARISKYHSKAREIAAINAEKIAVMDHYHIPYVIYEILSTKPLYDAKLLTSVRDSVVEIKTSDKEYMICFISSDAPRVNIEKMLNRYRLDNHVFVSLAYELEWLKDLGVKAIDIGSLDDYHQDSLKNILPAF
jgi:hypothetical protein